MVCMPHSSAGGLFCLVFWASRGTISLCILIENLLALGGNDEAWICREDPYGFLALYGQNQCPPRSPRPRDTALTWALTAIFILRSLSCIVSHMKFLSCNEGLSVSLELVSLLSATTVPRCQAHTQRKFLQLRSREGSHIGTSLLLSLVLNWVLARIPLARLSCFLCGARGVSATTAPTQGTG